MARIPQEEIERLKREVSLQRLVEQRGVKLARHGADLIGLCPFHEDHAPSLVVSPEKNLWHCLGACQAGGSVIDWVMKERRVSFRHAVEILRADLSPFAAPSSSPAASPASSVLELSAMFEREAADEELLRHVVEYYHETLKQSPEALEYLNRRGLESSEMIDRFKLGFSNRTLGYRLPGKQRGAGAAIRGRLRRLGLIRESGHEHFSGSLVIPVLDEQGRVQEIYGRKITDKLRKGTPLHLYLPGPHHGVWNQEALKASSEIILCEALLDALTFWCAGYRNVTSAYGVSGFTPEHLAAFKRHAVTKVLIAYDRDEAGEQAAQALAEALIGEGMSCYRVQFARNMDANEYALMVKPPHISLGVVLRAAVWLGGAAGGIQTAADGADLTAGVAPTREQERAAKKEIDMAEDHVCEPAPGSRMPVIASPGVDGETALGAVMANEPVVPASVCAHEIHLDLGERHYRVRGLSKNLSFDQLRVNLLVSMGEELFFVDTLDLYSARQRGSFIKQAAEDLGIEHQLIKKDLGRLLGKLEAIQEQEIRKALEPQKKAVTLTDQEHRDAMALLQDSRLVDRILADFDRCGVIGEHTNKLVGYLAAVSRKLEEPLAVVIQSSSAAGKSRLMESLLSFIPQEDRIQYSAMTGQSLFYMGEHDLKHKILAIVEEEGAERASYALKLLQSEGELTIASTGKDPQTGRLVTHDYRVQGPVVILLTTTAVDIDEELLSRCLVLTVNEDREQTRAIHKLQRQSQTLEGLRMRKDREHILKLHRNAQRLLRPLGVVNPYAERLTFLDDKTRMRRDHLKYLTLIRTIALLHQHQRPVKRVKIERGARTDEIEYVEVELTDIALANELAHEVLGRTLDELPPQTRRFLLLLDAMVAEACSRLKTARTDFRFSRREVRASTKMTDFQVRTHLGKLVSLEYVLVHRGGRGQSFVYELVYDGRGQDGKPFLMGLIDLERLRREERSGYDGKIEHPEAGFEHEKPHIEPSSSPQRASIEPPSSTPRIAAKASNDGPSDGSEAKTPENAHLEKNRVVSYLPVRHTREVSLLAAKGKTGGP